MKKHKYSFIDRRIENQTFVNSVLKCAGVYFIDCVFMNCTIKGECIRFESCNSNTYTTVKAKYVRFIGSSK